MVAMRLPVFLIFFVIVAVSGCADRLVLEKSSFAELPGWKNTSAMGQPLLAFKESCKKFATLPPEYDLGVAGKVKDWTVVCSNIGSYDANRSKVFFEQYFVPFKASNNGDEVGLFTGYYEPLLKGSYTKRGKYQHAIYKRPPDLEGDPYLGRRRIEEGELSGRSLELLYVNDAVDLFFLHIQGSGRVQMDDTAQRIVKVGYDGKNNCPYRSLGRHLIAQGEIRREAVTAQSIKQWLRDNPDRAVDAMNHNQSYVFFKEQKNPGGPKGAQGVSLTAEASLAVDDDYIPYGVPIWVDTTIPNFELKDQLLSKQAANTTTLSVFSNVRTMLVEEDDSKSYQRLFIAQDTGGALEGPVRGDIFFGHGNRAEKWAGHMKQWGYYYLLLPKRVAESVQHNG